MRGQRQISGLHGIFLAARFNPKKVAGNLDSFDIDWLARNHSEDEDYLLWGKYELAGGGDAIADVSNRGSTRARLSEFVDDRTVAIRDEDTVYLKVYDSEEDKKVGETTEAFAAVAEVAEAIEENGIFDEDDYHRRKEQAAIEDIKVEGERGGVGLGERLVMETPPTDWAEQVYGWLSRADMDPDESVTTEKVVHALEATGLINPMLYYRHLPPEKQHEVDELGGSIVALERRIQSTPAGRDADRLVGVLRDMVGRRDDILCGRRPRRVADDTMPLFDDKTLKPALLKPRQKRLILERERKEEIDRAMEGIKETDWSGEGEVLSPSSIDDVFACRGRVFRMHC